MQARRNRKRKRKRKRERERERERESTSGDVRTELRIVCMYVFERKMGGEIFPGELRVG